MQYPEDILEIATARGITPEQMGYPDFTGGPVKADSPATPADVAPDAPVPAAV